MYSFNRAVRRKILRKANKLISVFCYYKHSLL